jgi:hypothetical protein
VEFGFSDASRVGYAQTGGGVLCVLKKKVLCGIFREK